MTKIEFEGRVVGRGPGRAWCFLAFPWAASEQLGTKAGASVVVTINGASIRTSAFPMGDGRHPVNVNRAFQKEAGIAPGDRVRVSVEPDTRPRTVALPTDLRACLAKDTKARLAFETLAPSHKKAYVDWVSEAKRPETRERRVRETIDRLRSGDPRFYR